MKRMLGAAAACLIATAFGIGAANAQTSTTPQDLDVSITITNSCSVSNVVPIAFGSHGSLASEVTAAGSVDVNCTTDLPYEVALDAGDGTGATISNRLMTGPDDETIVYSLYKDALHTEVWGDEEAALLEDTGAGVAQTHTIYGRVGPQTTPVAGAYSDIVAVVVSY